MASQLTRRVLRVFLASPSDVGEERTVAERIASDVNKTVGRLLQWQIDLLKWEDKGPAVGRPQSIINPDVDQCDLFVGLLWEHWGHATGTHSSGFEEEFERAKARNQKTGEPQVWLVFKEPRAAKLTDLGPQLSAVLAFREKQIAANEVLFYRVKDTNEWERFLFARLTEHLLDLSLKEQSAQQQRAVTSSPITQSTNSVEVQEQENLLTGSKGQALNQIAQGYQILGRLIEKKHLEFAAGEEDVLKEFEAARLHLLSSTWMSKRYTGETLGTHEINQLYRYRSELQTASAETYRNQRCKSSWKTIWLERSTTTTSLHCSIDSYMLQHRLGKLIGDSLSRKCEGGWPIFRASRKVGILIFPVEVLQSSLLSTFNRRLLTSSGF
jgi:hypothetical protein